MDKTLCLFQDNFYCFLFSAAFGLDLAFLEFMGHSDDLLDSVQLAGRVVSNAWLIHLQNQFQAIQYQTETLDFSVQVTVEIAISFIRMEI